jgi:hypothetical protein
MSLTVIAQIYSKEFAILFPPLATTAAAYYYAV